MRIAVLVKQVPSTNSVKIDEKIGTMIRSASESELNPLDMYAAEDAVRDAISMGCSGGFLISDKVFAGSVLAPSKVPNFTA